MTRPAHRRILTSQIRLKVDDLLIRLAEKNGLSAAETLGLLAEMMARWARVLVAEERADDEDAEGGIS